MARFKRPTIQEDGTRLPKEVKPKEEANPSPCPAFALDTPPETDESEIQFPSMANPTDWSVTSVDYCGFNANIFATSSLSKDRIRRGTSSRMFRMRHFGTGLPNDPIYEYRTRISHLHLSYIQKATKSVRVEQVVRISYTEFGTTCHVILADSAPNRTQKIDHHDMWFCDNGPEALMRFVETTPQGSSLANNWRLRLFFEALRSYLDGDFRVVPSTNKFGVFVVEPC